jgi:hypothetical protein
MKSILQAILDEVYYPINEGLVENKIISRRMDPDEEYSADVAESDPFKGALADTLLTLIQQVNVSEADKSFGALTDKQREALLTRINNLYKAIGEEEVELEAKPMVYINTESWM